MDLGGALERAIMEILWAAPGPMRIRELMNSLNERGEKPLAYNTVQTVAERLTHKGLLTRVPDGIAFRYSPTRSREDHMLALMLDLLADSPDQVSVLTRLADSIPPGDAQRLLAALRNRGPRTQKG